MPFQKPAESFTEPLVWNCQAWSWCALYWCVLMLVEDEHTEPQMSLIDRRLCVIGWRIWGERGRWFSACGCGENYLITASVPCDSFHLDQFNNLTDTNFFTVRVAQPIWEWRIKRSLVVSLDSAAQGWGWNTGGKRSLADLSAHQAGLAGWTTWNILFWFVNWASREWDPLGESLWDHMMPWLCVAFIHKVSASPFPL